MLLSVNSLPIDNENSQKSEATVNEILHEINNNLKGDIISQLQQTIDNSNQSSEIVKKDDDDNSNVKIKIEHFTTAIPTDLVFQHTSIAFADQDQIIKKFSNGTVTAYEIIRKENASELNREVTSTENSDENGSGDSEESSEESVGCDALALDKQIYAYFATTQSSNDTENDNETTTQTESNILKISSTKSVTTSTEISIETTINDVDAQSTDIPESLRDSNSTNSTPDEAKEEVMKKIKEISAEPIILTQGV
jgi:hypothetical protein